MVYLTPETVHYGRASEVLSSRQRLLIGLHHQPEQVHRRTTSGHPTARGRLAQSTKRRFHDRAAVSVNSPGRLSLNPPPIHLISTNNLHLTLFPTWRSTET
ncbi:MAG: hypothetical protein ACOX9B_14295 [Candidatus Xenobium sp.]|nr:hypothetical protein [Burkholderiales bacterium]